MQPDLGRNLQPWRPILAIALWLETEHGMTGLFARLEQLSSGAYQKERSTLEANDPTRILILALQQMLGKQKGMEFTAAQLADKMNQVAKQEDVHPEFKPFATAKSVGKKLAKLRGLKKHQRADNWWWTLTRQELATLAAAHGVELSMPHQTHNTAGYPMIPPEVDERDMPRCGACQACLEGRACPVVGNGHQSKGLDDFQRDLWLMVNTP